MKAGNPEDFVTLEFDISIYSEQAVKLAIYDLDVAAQISRCGHDQKIINVKIPSSEFDKPSLKKNIFKAALDHQIRIDVQNEFGPIRKLIIAQAFFPCENLDQILDEIDL